MSPFAAWRTRRLEVKKAGLIARIETLSAVVKVRETYTCYVDDWIKARTELAEIEKRIEHWKDF